MRLVNIGMRYYAIGMRYCPIECFLIFKILNVASGVFFKFL